ncbi:alpha-1-acid glycoprotein 1-like [Tympanuchus pallidicinctus]|uniref:alpha-1-acid glycoprotein 1-like n=1 Tax=Tympanuchus pallidicinctus TaxID=109042 RepID=UPI00228717DC|nr:alpha-1-acid glycoprotein 1-like [Tympanuchus pallidicinctus]
MLAFLIPVLSLTMGLVRAHATDSPTCAPLVPAEMDNATVHRLLGHWVYIMGASQYPPHVAEMKELKYATYTIFPGRHEDEFNVTEIMRLNETCVVRNTSKIHVFRHNSTLVHEEGQEASMAELMHSDKDLFILKHFKDNHVGLSLSARTPKVTKEQLEEFEAQLRCHGFKLEEAIITSPKDACPAAGEEVGEGSTATAEPQQG